MGSGACPRLARTTPPWTHLPLWSMAVKESEHTSLPKRDASGEVSGVSSGLCTIEAGREGPGNTRGYSGRLLGIEKKVGDVSHVNLDSVRTGMPPTTN